METECYHITDNCKQFVLFPTNTNCLQLHFDHNTSLTFILRPILYTRYYLVAAALVEETFSVKFYTQDIPPQIIEPGSS